MKKITFVLSALMFYFCFNLNSIAQSNGTKNDARHANSETTTKNNDVSVDTLSFKKKIITLYPKLDVVDVVYIKEVKLFEIRTKDSQFPTYTNINLDFFILDNQILDPKNFKNITLERDLDYTKEVFNRLNFKKAIPIKFGDGKRKIAIFADPDCPVCKEMDINLHKSGETINATIYYFMNPLNIPGHEGAPAKAAKILCSKNPSESWKTWMTTDKLPANEGAKCMDLVKEQKNLSVGLGFNSTPTIMFDNGYVIKSAIDTKKILEIMKKR